LPQSPGNIGKLKRGHDGKIIRTGPSEIQPDISSETVTTPSTPNDLTPTQPPEQTTRRKRIYSTRLLKNLQSRSDHKTRASRQQIKIDSLLRDVDRARNSGALVDARGLTVREISLFERLQPCRRDVMRHEMEHFQTGQPYASFPQYFYVRGPLNRLFAISGIVKFDASPIRGNEKEMLIKLEKLRRTAPASRTPSNQDRQVAAELALLNSILRASR
jgi:hypothetical protein